MRTSPRPIFPLFRSPAQADLLTAIYLSNAPLSTDELLELTKLSRGGLHRLLQPLLSGGLVSRTKDGSKALYSANVDAPFYDAMLTLITVTEGPPTLLVKALSGVPGIERAFVFGSWAARTAGEPGHMPNDVDVIAIGTNIDRLALDNALASVSAAIRRPVEILVTDANTWDHSPDGFMTALKERPLHELALSGTATAATPSWEDEIADLL